MVGESMGTSMGLFSLWGVFLAAVMLVLASVEAGLRLGRYEWQPSGVDYFFLNSSPGSLASSPIILNFNVWGSTMATSASMVPPPSSVSSARLF